MNTTPYNLFDVVLPDDDEAIVVHGSFTPRFSDEVSEWMTVLNSGVHIRSEPTEVSDFYSSQVILGFEDATDAVHFRLRWWM